MKTLAAPIKLHRVTLTIISVLTLVVPYSRVQAQGTNETSELPKVPLEAKPAETDQAELAKKSQNPIANMISVPIQNNFNFGVGLDNDVQYVGNIQPVIPVRLSEDWNLINRTIIPILYQPRSSPAQGSAWGLGDIQYQGFFTPTKAGPLTWGVGPVVSIPSASDSALGSGQWSAGPGLVALTIQGPWVVGGVVNNIWSFAGDSDRRSVNVMTLQYFINYNIPDSHGWYVTLSPTITANWSAPGRNQWTVPVGGGVGKVFKVGKQPMSAQIQAFGFPAKPDNGPEWGIQFMLKFLFPK